MASLTITGIVVSLVAAGVSAYGQHVSGQRQSAIAQFNANQQDKEAATQMQSMQVQAALQKQQADANFKLRSAEAQAHVNNAQSIENQATGQDAIERANLVKRQGDFARMQGTQRAAIAASGVTESTGTPLDLLAETAMRIQQDQEEQHYGNELQRQTLFSEAAQERLGGKLALAGATLDRNSEVTGAALRDAASRSAYSAGVAQADITRLTGAATAEADDYRATATLFSAAGGAADTYYKYKPPTYKPV